MSDRNQLKSKRGHLLVFSFSLSFIACGCVVTDWIGMNVYNQESMRKIWWRVKSSGPLWYLQQQSYNLHNSDRHISLASKPVNRPNRFVKVAIVATNGHGDVARRGDRLAFGVHGWETLSQTGRNAGPFDRTCSKRKLKCHRICRQWPVEEMDED